MDINNMHIAVRQGVDKINSLQADSLLSQELDLELNKSMMKFINLKYGRNNIYGKGFEQSQKRIDDLSTLVSEYRGFTGFVDREKLAYYKGKFLYREFFSLPYDYMYHLESSCNVLRTKACKSSEFQLEYFNDADYTANTAYEDESKVLFIPFSYLKLSEGNIISYIFNAAFQGDGILKPFKTLENWNHQTQPSKVNKPFWWDAYNSIKHDNGIINKATLENAILALSALYITIKKVYGSGVISGRLLKPIDEKGKILNQFIDIKISEIFYDEEGAIAISYD
jgi:hypothetical protein